MSPENQVQQPGEPSLLPVVQGDEALLLLERLGQDGKKYRCNLPLEEEWAKSWFLKIAGLPDFRLENKKDQVFKLAYYHAQVVPVELKPTGEIVPRVRVVLFDDEGKTLAWTSEISTGKFGLLLASHGLGPWDPPLQVTIKAVPGKVAGAWYYFETPLAKRPAGKPRKGA